MRNLLIVFFIAGILILIILFPFKTRAMAHINLLEMKCFYSVKTWIIKLLCGKIEIENYELKMSNEKTLLSETYNNKFVKTMIGEVLARIDVKKFELFFTGGFTENSFSSAILCGTIDSVIESLYGYLSLTFDDVKLYKDIKPTFEENNLELTFDIVISISLLKLVMAIFTADKKVKKLKGMCNEG